MRIYFLFFLLSILTINSSHAQLNMYDSIIVWNHFDYGFEMDTGPTELSNAVIVEKSFQAIILENKFIKLALIPEYGGRIISFVYKPTGHEQLYKNPIGTPYGFNEGNFYYDFLMVYGGIFPTLTESEHGKSWFLPWNYEVIKNNEDEISIKMSWTDDIDVPYHPSKFNNGKTGLTCFITISIYKANASFDYKVDIVNAKNQNIDYEYWTCTTLSPGSNPDDTKSPGDSEMIVPTENIELGWNLGNWMQTTETSNNNGTYKYEELKLFKNWKNMGIAYADNLIDDFWGVINHENEEGIFRIADNKKTFGLKFWTWGFDNSISADPNNYDDTARPYIELWAGLSKQFFQDSQISANSTESWSERYMPSIGLKNVTHVTDELLVNFDYKEADQIGTFYASMFSNKAEDEYFLSLQIIDENDNPITLLEENFTHNPLTGKIVNLDASSLLLENGTYTYQILVKNKSGETIFDVSKIISININPVLTLNKKIDKPYLIKRIDSEQIILEFQNSGNFQAVLYNLNGKIIAEKSFTKSVSFNLKSQGLYLMKINNGDRIFVEKYIFNNF